MIRVAVLEDNALRQQIFKQFPRTVIYDTASEFIEYLKGITEEHILCLDHDLGGEVYVDTNREDCGMEVVRWIEENKPDNIREIHIHSWNTVAAEEMKDRLIKAGYKTFFLPFNPTKTALHMKYITFHMDKEDVE